MCRHGHEFGHGLDAHLFHHFVTMGLDGALCRSKLATDLVVMLALNHEVEDLSLARGQRQKASVAHVGLDLQFARSLVASNRSFDRAEKLLGAYWLGEEIFRTGFDRAHGDRNVDVAGEK